MPLMDENKLEPRLKKSRSGTFQDSKFKILNVVTNRTPVTACNYCCNFVHNQHGSIKCKMKVSHLFQSFLINGTYCQRFVVSYIQSYHVHRPDKNENSIHETKGDVRLSYGTK